MAQISINIKEGTISKPDIIVGIDLGTTNSLVAIINKNGMPEAMRDEAATAIVPSIIHFGKDGITVGNSARQHVIDDPENTIYSVKRLMGKSYKDIAAFQQHLGYKIIEDNTESLVKVKVGDKFYSPIELSSFILKELKLRAEKVLHQNITKAVITVSLFGQVSDHATINSIADAHNITVIEDAAQSFGATNNHIKSCNLTKIATTSFFPSKPLGAYGDGGACFTADEEIAIKIKKLRIHGQDYRYHHELLGLNARLDTIQAAILLAKLKVFDAEVKLRQEIGANYTQKLKNANCITPYIAEVNTHVYAQYSILVNNRDEFIKNLNNNNIPTAVHYPLPLHHQPSLMQYYDATVHQKLPYSEQISKQVVSVPMHPYLDENTQDYIVENVIKYAKL